MSLKLFVCLAVFFTSLDARAESTSQALETFGLTGTWSQDCAGDKRTIIVTSFWGSPIATLTSGNNDALKSVFEIKSATRVTDEKIKIVYIAKIIPATSRENEWDRQEGETWQVI